MQILFDEIDLYDDKEQFKCRGEVITFDPIGGDNIPYHTHYTKIKEFVINKKYEYIVLNYEKMKLKGNMKSNYDTLEILLLGIILKLSKSDLMSKKLVLYSIRYNLETEIKNYFGIKKLGDLEKLADNVFVVEGNEDLYKTLMVLVSK